MNIQIDFRSGVPIYIQIMEQIRQQVSAGELKLGDQLPTVRQMATDLRVNFNTVARAYRMLDEAGIISTQHGRGTYIWEQPSEEALQNLRQQSLQALTRHYLSQAHRQGHTRTEVTQSFQAEISNWENGNLPEEELADS
jgi:GntR family transcriptional regulator